MKELYIKDLPFVTPIKGYMELFGWVKSKRRLKNKIFFDLVDSTGEVQIVVPKGVSNYDELSGILPETAVKVKGEKIRRKNKIEILASDVKILANSSLTISPLPRSEFNVFDSKYSNQVLTNRHLYLRNEKISAIIKFKSKFIFEMHRYFQENGFVFLEAPVLTKLLLYDDSSAFKLKWSDKEDVWLSQCCTFQLESAICSHEKVYNITPSFRAEKSRSNRHLREYTHLKVELAWVDLKDLIKFAEDSIYTFSKNTIINSKKELEILGIDFNPDIFKPPYERTTYDDAVDFLHSKGKEFKWGKSLSTSDEMMLTEEFGDKLLWVEGIPCSAEGFPFKRNRDNLKLTRTCDLISSNGFGELLGTAEKITDEKELLIRMKEKGKTTKEQLKRYQWYVDLRKFGLPPHGGIGMGVERVIRFILKVPHVRDVMSFPRLYGRNPNP